MKRIISYIIVILLLGTAAWYAQKQGWIDILPKGDTLSSLQAVPANASVIVIVERPDRVARRVDALEYGSQLRRLEPVVEVASAWEWLESIIGPYQDKAPERLIASIHLVSSDAIDLLFLLEGAGAPRFDSIQGATVEEHTFEQEQIVEVKSPAGNMSYALVGGILIASRTTFLVEDAVKQLKTGDGLESEPMFTKLAEKPDNGSVSLYFNLENVPSLAPVYMGQEWHALAGELRTFCSWVRFDLNFSEELISLNGFAVTADTSDQQLTQMSGSNTFESQLERLIPRQATLLVHSMHTNDWPDGIAESTEGASIFFPWLAEKNKEWAFVLMESFDEKFAEDALALFWCSDTTGIANQITSWVGANDTTIVQGKVNGTAVYRLPPSKALPTLFGKTFSSFTQPYVAIRPGVVAMCRSLRGIRAYLEALDDARTLALDPSYQAFRESLATATNKYIYLNTSKLIPVIQQLASPSVQQRFDSSWAPLGNFGQIGLQFTAYKDLFMVNGVMRHHRQEEEKTVMLWSTPLDTTIALGPWQVYNHKVKGYEIMVQDHAHKLYMITKSGKISWSAALSGPLIGGVTTADFYKNKKAQYFFNTADKIYLADVNGRPVSHFPVELKSKATNPAFLVDYDGTRDYRYFIATEGGRVYGFGRTGKSLPNWNPKSKLGSVTSSVAHFSKDGKDHIVILGSEGTLYSFNRRGEERRDPVRLAMPHSPLQIVNGVYATTTDSSGNVIMVNSKGGMVAKRFGNMSADHQFMAFDLDSDTVEEFIFLDHQVLYAFGQDSTKKFTYKFSESFAGFMDIPPDQYGGGVNVTDTANNRIYHLSNRGLVSKGFPFEASTGFIISNLLNDGRGVLVCGDERGNVKAYRLER